MRNGTKNKRIKGHPLSILLMRIMYVKQRGVAHSEMSQQGRRKAGRVGVFGLICGLTGDRYGRFRITHYLPPLAFRNSNSSDKLQVC
jgi:hypothetical protein